MEEGGCRPIGLWSDGRVRWCIAWWTAFAGRPLCVMWLTSNMGAWDQMTNERFSSYLHIKRIRLAICDGVTYGVVGIERCSIYGMMEIER
eukprot:scaffold9853_cov31-Tisochrysis_lutea.AAC.3